MASGASSTDVVVVGGGIVGCASAYHLARRGVRVLLLDKGGSATSSPAGTWARGRDRTADVAGETAHGVAAVERTRSTFVERRRTGRVVVTNHVIAA